MMELNRYVALFVVAITTTSLYGAYWSDYPWRSDSIGDHEHRHIKHKHTKKWHTTDKKLRNYYPWRSDSWGDHKHTHISHVHTKAWHKRHRDGSPGPAAIYYPPRTKSGEIKHSSGAEDSSRSKTRTFSPENNT